MFRAQGLQFLHDDGITIAGSLSAGQYELAGDVSSQFITGLLFTLPLLPADSVIEIIPPAESLSYIALTLEVLAKFGIDIDSITPLIYKIKGGQRYKPCAEYTVEGDYSQAAFMAVLGAIAGDIRCAGMNNTSAQGDKAILDILSRSGANITLIDNGFQVKQSEIVATDIDLADCPDLGPILCVLAAYAKGTSRIYNASRLRLKESDRIAAMQTELTKLGVVMDSTDSEIIITGAQKYAGGVVLEGHNDHRIVMSLAVAAAMCDKPVIINGSGAVSKSYPMFFKDIEKLGVEIKIL
jgi:3-phosphoshikimate 1-carboxyvinyltransferase